MRLELDASMKKQKIQSNTSLLLSELQERILDEEVEIFA